MVIYTNKNCKKMYLSPYVNIRSLPDVLVFQQTLFDAEAGIVVPRSEHGKIVDYLQNGSGYCRGVLFLGKYLRSLTKAKKLFAEMLQNGILE